MISHKTCLSCNTRLALEEFHKNTNAKDGRQSRCRRCRNEAQRDYVGRVGIPTLSPEQRARKNQYDRQRAARIRAESPEVARLAKLKQRALGRGIFFDLSLGDIDIPDSCPCCGVDLKGDAAMREDNSPSVDRVRNDVGYVPENIVTICWRCNRLKSDADPFELRRIADWSEREATIRNHLTPMRRATS